MAFHPSHTIHFAIGKQLLLLNKGYCCHNQNKKPKSAGFGGLESLLGVGTLSICKNINVG